MHANLGLNDATPLELTPLNAVLKPREYPDTKWKYRGVMFHHPDPDARTSECPNFFKLGDEWLLFVSPYGKVQYFVGDFDAETCRFQPRTRGVLDHGPNFYAPNTMLVPDGRRLVWGWVNGFPGGRGWNGCLSLPRQLGLSRAGQLLQKPAPQLNKLCGKPASWRNVRLDSDLKSLVLPESNALEIETEIDLRLATNVSLGIKSGDKDPKALLSFNGRELRVLDAKAPLTLPKGDRKLKLRIFIDRSVLEVFANESACVTKTISPLEASGTLEIRAEGGSQREADSSLAHKNHLVMRGLGLKPAHSRAVLRISACLPFLPPSDWSSINGLDPHPPRALHRSAAFTPLHLSTANSLS